MYSAVFLQSHTFVCSFLFFRLYFLRLHMQAMDDAQRKKEEEEERRDSEEKRKEEDKKRREDDKRRAEMEEKELGEKKRLKEQVINT